MNEHNHTAITFEPTTSDDLDALVDIRIAAMRESLVRVGRFDPDRARERFQSGFSAADTRFILHDACRVGFLVVKTKEDHLLLDHRYILPQHQGKGIGSAILETIFREADFASLPLHVVALKESYSNRFYQQHDFVHAAEGQWDIYYIRSPRKKLGKYSK